MVTQEIHLSSSGGLILINYTQKSWFQPESQNSFIYYQSWAHLVKVSRRDLWVISFPLLYCSSPECLITEVSERMMEDKVYMYSLWQCKRTNQETTGKVDRIIITKKVLGYFFFTFTLWYFVYRIVSKNLWSPICAAFCLSVCTRAYTFSPEPHHQFSPNLAQTILS